MIGKDKAKWIRQPKKALIEITKFDCSKIIIKFLFIYESIQVRFLINGAFKEDSSTLRQIVAAAPRHPVPNLLGTGCLGL